MILFTALPSSTTVRPVPGLTCPKCGYQFATPPSCWRCGQRVSW